VGHSDEQAYVDIWPGDVLHGPGNEHTYDKRALSRDQFLSQRHMANDEGKHSYCVFCWKEELQMSINGVVLKRMCIMLNMYMLSAYTFQQYYNRRQLMARISALVRQLALR